MDELFNVIRSEADMLGLLLSQKDSFFFFGITFEIDIDLFAIVEANPIPGITLLDRKVRQPRSDVQKVLSPAFDCTAIQFDVPVSFMNCCFKIEAKFTKVIFKGNIDFRSSTFENGLDLNSTRAYGLCTFGFISNSSVSIFRCTFKMADNVYTETVIEKSYHINSTTFTSGLNLNRCKVKGQLNFSDVTIDGPLRIAEANVGSLNIGSLNPYVKTTIGDLDISETEFTGNVQLMNLNIDGVLRGQAAIFNDSVFFSNVIFKADTYLNHTTFHKSIFIEKTTVLKNISFYAATFNYKINFNDINISNANVSFTGAHINADLWVGKLLHEDATAFTGTLNFEGATIGSGSIVRIFNLNNSKTPSGKINFANALIRGLLDIRNVFVNEISFDGTVVPGSLQDNNTLHNAIRNRSTARLLKHEAKRINNMISATSYNKLEMELHAVDIKFKQTADWLILKFNYWSNDYGTNWLKATWFTLYTGFGSYFLFFICANKLTYSWQNASHFILLDGSFWSGFINYFWLPYGFKELATDHGVSGHILGAIFFILGKIFIAYGVYQIVTAFRKYTQ